MTGFVGLADKGKEARRNLLRLAAGALIVLLVVETAVLAKEDGWTRYENPGWAGRDGAGLLVLRDELYLLGGWLYGPLSNEVWKTSDLEHWEFLGNAPWPGRHGAAWLVHDDRLWVTGGDLHADVWSSPDGIEWTQEATGAPFGPRYTPNAVSLSGEILLYAGQWWDGTEARADSTVWSSRDGRDWTQLPNAPWEGRGLIHGSIVHDGEAFLIGGGLKEVLPGPRAETAREFTDIWSTSNGRSWTHRGEIPFPPRTHFSVVSTPHGCYVSDGSVGTQANLSRDLFFAEDCVTYRPVDTPDDMGVRHASAVAWFRDSLVILGGPDARAGTDVWVFKPPPLSPPPS
jgi:hypothetical protein